MSPETKRNRGSDLKKLSVGRKGDKGSTEVVRGQLGALREINTKTESKPLRKKKPKEGTKKNKKKPRNLV